MRNLQNYACCTPLNLRFYLHFWSFASKRHFAALTLRLSLNLIAVQKMANLQNTDTCITVFSQIYGAYHQNDTLKLFPQNCHLTPLRPKTLQLSKILSHDPESSFLSNDLLLILRVTFWSCYCKILAKPYYCPKVGQFAKHCQTPHNNPSQLVFFAYHQSVNLEPLR